ncbi:MAG TPA: hypothetical protein VHB02_19610 [Acidimicrobiales bacterium]|nr:hypothetical protein [Acidimicrobiales bacterium]
MTTLELPALVGTNPLGFLAALGVLDVADRHDGEQLLLRWSDDLRPHAVVEGVDDLGTLVDLVEDDRQQWIESPLLTWGPDGKPLDDVKPSAEELHTWAEHLYCRLSEHDHAAADLWCALLAEGAFAGRPGTGNDRDAKPTHLHFTAGQQQFLKMARELAGRVDRDRVEEALVGPWRYDSDLPSFRWDLRGERLYAVSARNPSTDPPRSVPAANWLAFLGLRFFPVVALNESLRTTLCAAPWKSGGSLTWPLWHNPLSASSIFSMLTSLPLAKMGVPEQQARGLSTVLQAPIRRTDQGGYGSFGAPIPVFGGR